MKYMKELVDDRKIGAWWVTFNKILHPTAISTKLKKILESSVVRILVFVDAAILLGLNPDSLQLIAQ